MFLGTEDQVFSRRFAGRRGVPRIADLEPTDSFPFKRPVFTHSTRFRRIIILILRKSRDAHFHSPIHRRVTPSIVIPSRKFLFLFFSFVRESSLSRFVVPAGASGQDRDRWKGAGREEESKRQERYRGWSGIRVEEGGRGGRERKRGTTSSRPDHSKFPGGNKGPATSWSNYPIHLNWRASERISARRYQEVHFTAFEHHPSSYETLPSKFMHVPYAAIQRTTSPSPPLVRKERDFDVRGKIVWLGGRKEGRKKKKKKEKNTPFSCPCLASNKNLESSRAK